MWLEPGSLAQQVGHFFACDWPGFNPQHCIKSLSLAGVMFEHRGPEVSPEHGWCGPKANQTKSKIVFGSFKTQKFQMPKFVIGFPGASQNHISNLNVNSISLIQRIKFHRNAGQRKWLFGPPRCLNIPFNDWRESFRLKHSAPWFSNHYFKSVFGGCGGRRWRSGSCICLSESWTSNLIKWVWEAVSMSGIWKQSPVKSSRICLRSFQTPRIHQFCKIRVVTLWTWTWVTRIIPLRETERLSLLCVLTFSENT